MSPTSLCGGGAAMDCAPTNNPAEKGLTPDALRVMRCITETFGERPWANIGDRPSGVDRDHQEGRAVDAMMTEGDDDYRTPAGRAKGDAIADFVVKNADALGVKYVIWYEKIWTRSQDAVGQPGCWGPYDYPLGGNSTDTRRPTVTMSTSASTAMPRSQRPVPARSVMETRGYPSTQANTRSLPATATAPTQQERAGRCMPVSTSVPPPGPRFSP